LLVLPPALATTTTTATTFYIMRELEDAEVDY